MRHFWARVHDVYHCRARFLALSSAVCSNGHFAIHESDRSIVKTLLQLAGFLQFSILIASALVPRVLNWRRNLAGLNPFLRKLFWVYGVSIVLVIIAFATLTFLHTGAMAAGEPVARSLCGFIAIFWTVRLVVQITVFDARPFLTTWFYKLGYHTLTLIFTYLVLTYAWAAIFPHTNFSL